MNWRRAFGGVAARLVQGVALGGGGVVRPLADLERRVLHGIFGDSLDPGPVRLHEGIGGLLNVSRRAFVIENAMYLPREALPLRRHLLVHEAVHVWQFQNGGHAYIGDSVHAQLFGDGYELEKGLLQGRAWAELNAEQQATLIEASFTQGCFDGRPFIVRGQDWTGAWARAVAELRAGRGASFTRG